MLKELNDLNPGSEKRFELSYLNVETRQVTVYAKTVEEAYIKATKTVENRHKNRFVSGFRFDDKFKILYINVLKQGIMKFKNAPFNSIADFNAAIVSDLRGAELGPDLLDNNSKAA